MDQESPGGSALAFRPRLDRVEDLIRARVEATGTPVADEEHLWDLPAISLFELFPAEDWLPPHYGRVSRALWTLVDQVFKAADLPEDCPPGSSAKSVQIADVYEMVVPAESRTTFLSLWFKPEEPVLIAAPEIPLVLLDPQGARLGQTRSALHRLIWEMVERLNIAMPAARSLAVSRASEPH
ncbi:MAG: hypothetical protein JST59_05855 [Actinobacteria bacterium]|nr:hypothetical protein [Actinomycetota bacterium]